MPETAKTAEPAKAEPKTLKGTVAKGRTLRAGGGPIYDAEKKVIGHNDGRDFGPGEEVELSVEEFRDAVKHGFINNPDADQPVISTGPKIQTTEGPSAQRG